MLSVNAISLYITLFASFCTTITLVLLCIPIARQVGLVDKPGARKRHREETPLVGGIAMFGAFVITMVFNHLYVNEMLGLLSGAFLLTILGILDDYHELNVWSRFIGQTLATLIMFFLGGKSVENLGPLFGENDITLGFISLPFTIFATIGIINAINMVDGADGLAGGVSLIAFSFFVFFASLSGNRMNLVVLVTLIAVVLAFLLFNFRFPGRPCALIFMGDAGSMFLGFALCWFAVDLSQGNFHAMKPVTALWILAVPLFDTVAVMVRRITNGLSPFTSDCKHLHHLLMEQLSPHQPPVDNGSITNLIITGSPFCERGGGGDDEGLQAIQSDVLPTVIIILMMAILLGFIGVTMDMASVPQSVSFLLFLTTLGIYLRLTLCQHRLKRVLTRIFHRPN